MLRAEKRSQSQRPPRPSSKPPSYIAAHRRPPRKQAAQIALRKKEVSTVHPHHLRSANDSQVFQPPAVRFRVMLPAQRCSFYKLPGKDDREQQLVARGAEAPTAEPGDEAFSPGPRHF